MKRLEHASVWTWRWGALWFWLCACAGVTPREAPRSSGNPPVPGRSPSAEARCFVELPGTFVTYADAPPDGVVLTYSAQANDIASLRALVHAFADRQNRAGASRADVSRALDPSGSPILELMPPGTAVLVTEARASASDAATGVQLELAPVAPPVRALLRRDIEARAQGAKRTCPPSQLVTPAPVLPGT